MLDHHHELEETLRSLTTAAPPAHVRSRILAQAVQQAPRRGAWRGNPFGRLRAGLALALGLLLLIGFDLGVSHLQDARIAALMGNQPQPVISPVTDRQFALALAQQRTLVADLVGEGQLQ